MNFSRRPQMILVRRLANCSVWFRGQTHREFVSIVCRPICVERKSFYLVFVFFFCAHEHTSNTQWRVVHHFSRSPPNNVSDSRWLVDGAEARAIARNQFLFLMRDFRLVFEEFRAAILMLSKSVTCARVCDKPMSGDEMSERLKWCISTDKHVK